MKNFVQRHGDKILGVLSGFDRIRFRGSLGLFSNVGGLASWLYGAGVLLKDFLPFAEQVTKEIQQSTKRFAQNAGRPVCYLDRKLNKEEIVQRTLQGEGIADNGLITVLSTLETCLSFDIFRNRGTHKLELCRRMRRCLHYYFYFRDGRFGLTQVRLMTWFPFDVHIVINGREWLSKELDKRKIGYGFEGISDISTVAFGR